jgi:hypothetical protein
MGTPARFTDDEPGKMGTPARFIVAPATRMGSPGRRMNEEAGISVAPTGWTDEEARTTDEEGRPTVEEARATGEEARATGPCRRFLAAPAPRMFIPARGMTNQPP